MNEDVGELLTSTEAATRLGVSSTSVTNWRISGLLPATRTPLGYFFDPEDVARLRAERASLPKRHGRVVVGSPDPGKAA